MTFKDQKLNPMNFQALKMKFLNSMTFLVFHDLCELCQRLLKGSTTFYLHCTSYSDIIVNSPSGN